MNPSRPEPRRVERHGTIVIGAGQAGLAVGRELLARDVDVTIIDAAARIGESWRRRWDSLRLFTPAKYSGLPGMVFPAPAMHLPDKDEVADYLERYAERFDLPVRLRTAVTSLARAGDRFVVRSGVHRLEADHVVIATGPFQRPALPPVAAELSPVITQLHTSQYVNPHLLPEGPVLVVGAGNSGAQVALELSRTRAVTLAGRTTGHLPRRALGRDLYDWIWPVLTRATTDTRLGRRIATRATRGDPLIGIPADAFARAGIRRVGRLTGVRDGLPICDGEAVAPAVVVWATGFRPDYSWVELPILDALGRPRHVHGIADGVPGLSFVGLRFQRSMTSALLGGVGRDAAHVAAYVARRVALSEGP